MSLLAVRFVVGLHGTNCWTRDLSLLSGFCLRVAGDVLRTARLVSWSGRRLVLTVFADPKSGSHFTNQPTENWR